MTASDAHDHEPTDPDDAEPRDPYGFGPGARISIGGYFPSSAVDQVGPIVPIDPVPADGERLSGDRQLYAVAYLLPSRTEHAVPWRVAVPGDDAATACGVRARVADISRSRVIWIPGPLMCHECASVVTGRTGRDGPR
ncbi:hypothetical protein AB0M95_21355 [Sphaerisporangium sp. NPDC051017]|uniref:hypothetical protein n=1 Tax=Sphaerisporangium sp. NPDC051017 TaxID=3154636 RepID=UPI0034372FAD